VADTWGFLIVFLSATAASLLGGVLAWKVPARSRGNFRLAPMQDVRSIAVPVGLFVLTAGSFGAVTSFMPLSGPDAGTAAFALLATSVALVIARFAAGRVGDRYGAGRLLIASVLVDAIGCQFIAVSLNGPAWVLLIGASLLGAGFGAGQNESFVVTVQRLGATRSGAVSTIWDIAYDGGLGLGAFSFEWVIGQLGYAGAFIAICVGITTAALLCTRHTGSPHSGHRHPARQPLVVRAMTNQFPS
jgi:MFS family permease